MTRINVDNKAIQEMADFIAENLGEYWVNDGEDTMISLNLHNRQFAIGDAIEDFDGEEMSLADFQDMLSEYCGVAYDTPIIELEVEDEGVFSYKFTYIAKEKAKRAKKYYFHK